MPARYAALPNPRNIPEDVDDELEAAFDNSDDDDDDDQDTAESRPLNPTNTSTHDSTGLFTHDLAAPAERAPHIPGTYDFDNVDYDYPPPGSPPRRDRAIPENNLGNTNGLIPSSPAGAAVPREGWLRRTAGAILPTHYAARVGLSRPVISGAVGSGTRNDGVFANVTAKPTPPRVVVEGDDIHIAPEDVQKDAPPSYASAQADAVPPYWETTVHAPFSPGEAGEMIIEGLQTGALFSFLWNMLVSISFQFIGFLLTYLLHTTHAAKYGSRAGLGVTLIQYGFSLRADRLEGTEDGYWSDGEWKTEPAAPAPSFDTAADADSWFAKHPTANATMVPTDTSFPGIPTTEWLSFLLMTMGWFILLTSLLGYWRVKRWERSIVGSNRPSQPSATSAEQDQEAYANVERAFSWRFAGGINSHMLRQGLGLGPNDTDRGDDEEQGGAVDEASHPLMSPSAPQVTPTAEQARAIAAALANERRLQDDLRSAGLL